MKFLILTVSDTCSKDPTKDASGPALAEEVQKTFPAGISSVKIVPDDVEQITKEILYHTEVEGVDAIFTTGGTGFGPRDVTPEATKSVIQREAPAITTIMTIESQKYTPMAMLSRSIAGIRNKTLIINFPGSVKAVRQCYGSIASALPHAISLIRNETESIKNVHDSMNGDSYSKSHEHICPHKTSKVDISIVARRHRESPFPMIEVSEALEIVKKEMYDLEKAVADDLPLAECLGRSLATDVRAVEPLPPFPASIKDGYACISADGAGSRTVRGAVCAGDVPERPMIPGECVRVNTGAPLPPGADCVVQVEDTKLLRASDDGRTELEIVILKAPQVGEDVRPVGHDISSGETVVRAGTLLDAGNIGILATVGVMRARVFSPPPVALLSTGNELQDPGAGALLPGQIRDSNKIMLIAMLKEYGFESINCGLSKDDPISMKSAIESALDRADVLITTGSVSMGERDMLKPVLVDDFGATIHFGRTNMKPGKPTTFATCERGGRRKYIFGLPGNPVSAYVTALLFAVPALRRCAGLPAGWAELAVKLEAAVKLDARPEYARATLQFRSGSQIPIVKLTGNQCSSRLLSTCGAAVLVALPGAREGRTELPAGATVTALLTTRPGPNV